MGLNAETIGILLALAALVAIGAERLRVPYTVCLVVVGSGLAFVPGLPTLTLTRGLVFSAFLPPLIFEAAFHLKWPAMRRDLPLLVVMSTVGVAISTAIVALGMFESTGWKWSACLLFAVLISATDPVSVIAIFWSVGVKGRLRLLVEAESLLNDGTVAVAFVVAAALASGVQTSTVDALARFVESFVGGAVCGGAIACVALFVMGRTEDRVVEIALTAAVAFGSFLTAERLHASGVIATLVAGLAMGNYGHLGALSDASRAAVVGFWEFAAFTVNSLVFLMMGVGLARVSISGLVAPIASAIALVLIGRAASVYGCCGLFAKSRWKAPWGHQHALVWGGLRGALALALVLGLPLELPNRDAVRAVSFVVVAFSVVGQGLTVGPLVRRLGIVEDA